MGRRLPPLNAVRAFEAAARHLSFTRAAEELNVTQAAVSHQVKALEDRLGVPLFRRLNRGLLLTDAGGLYRKELEDILDRLEQATERLRATEAVGLLTVSTNTSFASKWLVPRLQRFRDRRPDIDVRIDADDALTDFRRDNVDLAIRYGSGIYEGLHSVKLLQDTVFPVCSPKLLEGPHPLRAPEDLQYHTLLHDQGVVEDWPSWLRSARLVGAGRVPARFSSAPGAASNASGMANAYVIACSNVSAWPSRQLAAKISSPTRVRVVTSACACAVGSSSVCMTKPPATADSLAATANKRTARSWWVWAWASVPKQWRI